MLHRGLILALGATMSLACAESPAAPTVDPIVSFAKGGGGRGGGPGGDEGPVAQLTVRDDAGDGISSDNGTAYIDGAERVEVAITADDFHFKPSTHKKGTRTLSVSLGAPTLFGDVDPFDEQPQELGQGADFRIHSGISTLACDDTVVTFGRLSWFGSLNQGPYYHLAFGVPDLGGDSLTITRVGDSESSTWTITSTGTGYLRADAAYQGTFNVPFEFTVTGEGC